MNGRHSLVRTTWLVAVLLMAGVLVATAGGAPAPDAPPLSPDPPPGAQAPRQTTPTTPAAPSRARTTVPARPFSSPIPSRTNPQPRVTRPTPPLIPPKATPKPARPGAAAVRARQARERASLPSGYGPAENAALSLALIIAGALAVLVVAALGGRGLYRDRESGVGPALVNIAGGREQIPTPS